MATESVLLVYTAAGRVLLAPAATATDRVLLASASINQRPTVFATVSLLVRVTLTTCKGLVLTRQVHGYLIVTRCELFSQDETLHERPVAASAQAALNEIQANNPGLQLDPSKLIPK